MTSKPESTILQVKISLVGVSTPLVWRRLLIPGETRLDRFHSIIQQSMGWQDYHMHVFSTESGDYGVPDPDLEFRDESGATLAQLLSESGDRIRYTYDFGDSWEHDIVLEKVLGASPDQQYPTCLAGKSACPPEDCGGVWGYADLREALANPEHEEHANMIEWMELESASAFDPAAFDADAINESLAFFSAVR